jgi:hypothetical protein
MNFLRRLFRKNRPELVRYYDAATKTVVRIPKAELRPGVVLVQVRGEAEPMYADASDLKLGSTIHHSSLSEELRDAIARLAADLADVYPQSASEWEDGFRRDRDPEREVAGWLHLAAILSVMSNRYGYDEAQKRECFRILVACFTGDRETVRERSDPELLASSEVEQAIKYFYEGGYR